MFLFPIVLAGLFLLIYKTFVEFRTKEDKEIYKKEKRWLRVIILLSRGLIFSCLIIALASPFSLKETVVPGDISLMILSDNSSSFSVFDNTVVNRLYDNLKDTIPIELRSIGNDLESALGDGILQNMQGDDNILVITDGYSNKGKLLGDMISFASGLNSTINALNINPVKSDVGIVIGGPSQTIIDVVEGFQIKVNNVGSELSYHITVSVDENVIVDEDAKGDYDATIKRSFSEGYHKITAKLSNIGSGDYFEQNNEFYKTVKVVERPLVLFISEKTSPLEESLNKIYNVEKVTSLPSTLSKYSAIVIDDISAQRFSSKANALNDYVQDGNGLLVIGGENSYDRDGSLRSLDSGVKVYNSLLPVKIGSAEEGEKSDVNIVVVIDASSGTKDHIDVEKALAISILESLNPDNNVGVIAFYSESANPKIGLISEIIPLKLHINETKRRISRLTFNGQSYFDYGILSAHTLLKGVSGSKNIIFISDGSTTYEKLREDTRNAVIDVSNKGTKVYVVGVGSTAATDDQTVMIGGSSKRSDDFLSQLAILGNGNYFPADASNRLKILFGEQEKNKETEFYNMLVILENTHFITFNTSLDAVVSGYNLAIPKPSSRMLVTTNKNIPMLVVWRFGLGRVATLATDDGSKWAGELLGKENSRIITKTINWVIGDMSKNKEYDVTIKDTNLGKEANIRVISNEVPKEEGLSFYKRDINSYTATFMPGEEGFHEKLEATYAVNYNDEYRNIGINREFLDIINASNGAIFEPDDIDGILSTIKSVSKRIKMQTVDYAWAFLVAALIIFLGEIFIRRVNEKNRVL